MRVTNAIDPDGIHRHLQELVNGGHSLVNVLPQLLGVVVENKVWKKRVRPDGRPFGSLAEYLLAHHPFGAGCESHRNALTYAQLMELCADFPKVRDILAREAPKGKRGGDRKSESSRSDHAEVLPLDRHGGNTVPVLSARLAQEHPEVWGAYLNGEYQTVTAAAIAAGLITNSNAPLKRLKENWRRASKAERKAFLEFIREGE